MYIIHIYTIYIYTIFYITIPRKHNIAYNDLQRYLLAMSCIGSWISSLFYTS